MKDRILMEMSKEMDERTYTKKADQRNGNRSELESSGGASTKVLENTSFNTGLKNQFSFYSTKEDSISMTYQKPIRKKTYLHH